MICLLGLLDGSGGGVPGRLDSLVKGVALSLAFMEHHCVPDTEEMESPGEMEKVGLGPAFK